MRSFLCRDDLLQHLCKGKVKRFLLGSAERCIQFCNRLSPYPVQLIYCLSVLMATCVYFGPIISSFMASSGFR